MSSRKPFLDVKLEESEFINEKNFENKCVQKGRSGAES